MPYNSIEKRCVLVIDPIQTTYLPQLDSSPGTVSQVRAAYEFTLAAKTSTILILVGHLTKDGAIAGPSFGTYGWYCFILWGR